METRNLDDIKGNPKNPRRISEHDFEALKKSILEFGDLSGIVFNIRTERLVGGHQRVEAFKRLAGQKTVAITQRFEQPNKQGTVAIGHVELEGELYGYREVDWDEGREHAANIAANRIQGEFDTDMLAELTYELSQLEDGQDLLALTGQTENEISNLLDSVGAKGERDPAEDEAPELDTVNPPISQPGEIYQLGKHRLMCGDSTDFGAVSDLMDGKEADMIFTDPPYNVAYEGKTKEALTIQNDSMSNDDFYKFLYDVHANMCAVTKAGGAIYVCHADSEGMNFRKALLDSGFLLKQCIIWVKQSMVMGRQDYQWQHEPILYGWKDGASHYFVDDRTQTTVWNIDRPSRNEEHPTMKPIELCEKAIKNSSKVDNIVLDLFSGSGSGSTLIACEQTGRICYGMELDPRYCDVIRKRYAKHTGAEDWVAATPVVQKADETPAEDVEQPVAVAEAEERLDATPLDK